MWSCGFIYNQSTYSFSPGSVSNPFIKKYVGKKRLRAFVGNALLLAFSRDFLKMDGKAFAIF